MKLALLLLLISGVALSVVGNWREQRALRKLPELKTTHFGFLPGEGMQALGGMLAIGAGIGAFLWPLLWYWLLDW